jgi:redox-sensitive bicupin YhaK (pirin superfamily)
MTAGEGIQHSEMFPLLKMDAPNPLDLFQIWLNLPKAKKMCKPHFTMFWKECLPVVEVSSGAKVRVIAGLFEGSSALPSPPDSWAADPAHDVAVWVLELAAGSSVHLPPATRDTCNRCLYTVSGGSVNVNDEELPQRTGAVVNARVTIDVRARETSVVLVLQGVPIGEPVVQHGPFVMNTQQEIMEAFSDFRRTGFGSWPWPSSDHTHSRETSRHARHPNGKVEAPPTS